LSNIETGVTLLRSKKREWLAGSRQRLDEQITEPSVALDKFINQLVLRVEWVDRDQALVRQRDNQWFPRIETPTEHTLGIGLKFTEGDYLRVHGILDLLTE
jgi:hypothetical protein